MNKLLSLILFLLISSSVIGQAVGRVDKKTKEFSVPADQKVEFTMFGYEYANITTRKMICFSSNVNSVRDNACPLGAYFDTDKMKAGDRILYLGQAGTFAKMNFISGSGKQTLFYLPKSSFIMK
jgi:hypothetical protein